MNRAGRFCPTRYHYGATALAKAPTRRAETLYVIGGLYGNPQALEAILTMADKEKAAITLFFNGDFNWFNYDDTGFREINEAVLQHDAILGNVEAEFGNASNDAGCGCAYPDSVGDKTVERSNRIHARLRQTAQRHPELCRSLEQLPMYARYLVGDIQIGVVHGDAESLAGWRFDVAELDKPGAEEWLTADFAEAGVDVFASSHTCLPVMRQLQNGKLIVNNGAAGMPNFSGCHYGVLTRISRRPSPLTPLYGSRIGDIFVDALPIHYDDKTWRKIFLNNWSEGSPAWESYFRRICDGPDYSPTRAACRQIDGEVALS